MSVSREDRIDDELLMRLMHDIREFDTDLRAEVIASGLIYNGLHPDKIIIQPLGNSQRSYRKDVSAFYTEAAEYDNKEYLYLHTHRDGLYDALPENIFHQPTRGRTEKNKEEVIDEIKKHREEEKAARKFFLPFEHEYNYVKTLLNLLEEDFEKNSNNSKLIQIFSEHWPILKRLDTYHAYIFLRIIPLIHTIRNNFELASKSISLILGVPVEVKSCKTITSNVQNGALFKLGGGLLGIDSVIGTSANDGEDDLKINIGPLPENRINDFLSDGKYETIMEELLDYFFGANYLFNIELIATDALKQFTLTKHNATLGVNSFL